MPGRFFLRESLSELADRFGVSGALPDDPGPRMDAAPGEPVHAIVGGTPHRLLAMRWGMIPVGRRNARGRPVLETIVNARSETVFDKSAFDGVRRAILPVSGWYEWTGEKRRKTRWQIAAPHRPVLAFAAIWDLWQGPGGIELAQLATVTCAPNADIAPCHDRMPVILPDEAWGSWLDGTEAEARRLTVPAPTGLLAVTAA